MKIMVSACLLGENCKYSGGNNLNAAVVRACAGHQVIPVCPEVMGGLPTPRVPAEIVNGVVTNCEGVVVDEAFRAGAAMTLEQAQQEGVCLAVLQSRSPSCGVRQVYDGTFTGALRVGQGVTAELLAAHGFRLIDSGDTAALAQVPLMLSDIQAQPLDLQKLDAHCHLEKLSNAAEYAATAAAQGYQFWSMTCDPRDYEAAAATFENAENVTVGVGLHPWWVDPAQLEQQLAAFDKAAENTKLIGEIGLDFAPAHIETQDAQVRAFRHIAEACAKWGGKVISVHAVRAAGVALDILEETGALANNTCIFHWFSGSNEELQRACRAGCYFSVGPRMLQTKRGRAYVAAMPPERVLFETDCYPEGEGNVQDHLAQLAQISW